MAGNTRTVSVLSMLLVLVVSSAGVTGCYPVYQLVGSQPAHRWTDDNVPIPHEWTGKGFPKSSHVTTRGPVDYESLYVHQQSATNTHVIRLWPSGHALWRSIRTPPDELPFELHSGHGDLKNDMPMMMPDGDRSSEARVGRWRLHEDEMYIELFHRSVPIAVDFMPSDYVTHAGPLTEDGFILERSYFPRGFPKRWRWQGYEQPYHYERIHVGPMEGEPTW